MQKNLPRWKLKVFWLILLYCLSNSAATGQLSFTCTQTSVTYSANISPTIIHNDGTDDNLSSTKNIGFTFRFGCADYTSFKVSSNGWMSLGDDATQSLPTNNLNTQNRGPILAPLWDDLRVASSGNVNMKLSGSAPNRVLTVEWKDMRWSRSSSQPVMSFQVKLYETTNIIEFTYERVGGTVNAASASIGLGSGSLSGDFYSIYNVGNASMNYGTETSNISNRPNSNVVYRWTPGQYLTSTSTQYTGNISRCDNTRQPILGVQITHGCNYSINLTQLQINMTGTTNISDVTNIHVFYTGNTPAFSPVNDFGTVVTPAGGTLTVDGVQTLVQGVNYFWIAYDINASGTGTGNCDAQCTQLTAGGINLVPSSTNPAGSRPITGCTPSPGGIINPSFWVSGNSGTSSTVNNTKINQWNDQSGNNRHATQPTVANRPTYYDNSTHNVNFNPVVDFDEAAQAATDADFMDITSNNILSVDNNPYEVYAVIVPGPGNLTKPGKFLFSGDLGTNTFNSFDVRSNYSFNDSWALNDLISSNKWTSNYPALATFRYNINIRELYTMGSLKSTRSSVPRASPNINSALGCQRATAIPIEFYDGAIAEIITYANIARDPEPQKKIESYLAIKYGMTIDHSYYSSDRVTVWNRSLNIAYNNNIIGIARDDNGALLQKQSKSTSVLKDILTIYVGPSKQINQAANTGSFSAGNKSFFIVGSNNDIPLASWPQTTERPAGICCRIMREWLVQKTNFTNNDLKLEFDFNDITTGYLPLNAADLRLLVDGDGDFSDATILGSPSVTINAAAGVATVTVPASLLPNNSYFTLASVSANTSLPLDLKAFTGACRNGAVQLKWATTNLSEQDFVVERSADKVNFSPVGTVPAHAVDNYSWTDQSPLPGTLYYRLKTTKNNGEPLFSAIIGVNGCNKTGIQLSTNPGNGESTLMLQLEQKDRATISVYDLAGRRLEVPDLTGQRSFDKGIHYLPVRIPGIAAGMYLLHVTIHEEPHVFRIIKK